MNLGTLQYLLYWQLLADVYGIILVDEEDNSIPIGMGLNMRILKGYPIPSKTELDKWYDWFINMYGKYDSYKLDIKNKNWSLRHVLSPEISRELKESVKEMYYRPGKEGFLEAQKDFNQLLNNK